MKERDSVKLYRKTAVPIAFHRLGPVRLPRRLYRTLLSAFRGLIVGSPRNAAWSRNAQPADGLISP